MGARFIPVVSFTAKVNGFTNSYLKGALYTVHDTPNHQDLARKCKEWQEAGRIVIVGATSGNSVPGSIAKR